MTALRIANSVPRMTTQALDMGVGYWLSASNGSDFDGLAPGDLDRSTVAVPGAALGDPVIVGIEQDLGGATVTGYVSAADTVDVVAYNGSAGVVTITGVIHVRVGKFT